MKFRYITIEREYGSGGTKIARSLSEATGVPCYGYEILEAVAKKQGIPVERIISTKRRQQAVCSTRCL